MRSLLQGAHQNTQTISLSVFPAPKGCSKEEGPIQRRKCVLTKKGELVRNGPSPMLPLPH